MPRAILRTLPLAAMILAWPVAAAAQFWTPISAVGAPTPRESESAVWTGSKMIIWGGLEIVDHIFNDVDTGGVYDPASDTWTSTTRRSAPSPRGGHTAVWTGSRMIVWGGWTETQGYFNTGGIYDPAGGVSPLMGFYTVAPCRVSDSRLDYNSLFGNWNAFYWVGGLCNVPATAKAVSLNLTVLPNRTSGHLRLYPFGGPVPQASAINFAAGQVRANSAVVSLGDDGQVGVHAHQTGLDVVDLILDVNGYFQ
jgi:hypothetical protein